MVADKHVMTKTSGELLENKIAREAVSKSRAFELRPEG